MGELVANMAKEDMHAIDISEDEFAKSHGRYLVGGLEEVAHERLFRFGALHPLDRYPIAGLTLARIYGFLEFPERPGALRKFLHGLKTDWNISLFHYRNHGAGEPCYFNVSSDDLPNAWTCNRPWKGPRWYSSARERSRGISELFGSAWVPTYRRNR